MEQVKYIDCQDADKKQISTNFFFFQSVLKQQQLFASPIGM